MAGLLLVISTGLWCEGKPRYRNHSFATYFKHKTDKTRDLHLTLLGNIFDISRLAAQSREEYE